MSRKIYIIIAVVFTVVLSVSTFFIIRNHIDSAKQNEVYDNLAEIVEDEPPKENEGVTFSEDKDYFAEYLELYRQNEDMVGWIKVEDTNINYPVVQSVNEPNFYLKHKFDKTYSAYGCPYVQENCDVQKPSDNIIIYGHHMNDGSMFTGLMKYRNKSFWEGHKTITFDTLTDRHQYEVIAVFKTVVYTNSSDSFKYYEFTDAENAAEFDAYVAKCKELSLYDTGVSAEYGDKLISLSTCEYYDHRTEGSKSGCYFNVNTTKTPASMRQVPMLGFVKEAFEQEKQKQEDLGLHCEVTIDGYTDFIFINRFGQAQHQATLNKAIRRIIRDCNDEQFLHSDEPDVLLPHFSCHSLRHTFTTRMCEAGVNIKVIQDALGHSDISTTLNIYADVTKEMKAAEFKGLDSYFIV